MQCIEKLKEIGLHEINAKTKIATKRLDDILECRFDNIDRIRLKGFLYILEREYKIDMSEWLEKYDEYHKEQEDLKKENEKIQETKEQDSVNISFVDTTIENKAYKRLLIVFVVLFAVFVVFFIYNNSSSKKNTITKSSPIVESIPAIDSNTTIESSEEILDSNAKIESSEESSEEILDSNATITENNYIDSNHFGVEEAVIIPHSPLWVGIIDLQTYKKKQVSITEAFSIKLDDSKIIRTGHGYFDIKSPNINKNYISGDSKYFVYTRENGFSEITKDEYLAFNRGEEW